MWTRYWNSTPPFFKVLQLKGNCFHFSTKDKRPPQRLRMRLNLHVHNTAVKLPLWWRVKLKNRMIRRRHGRLFCCLSWDFSNMASSIKSDMVTQRFMVVDLFYSCWRHCVTCFINMLKTLPRFPFIYISRKNPGIIALEFSDPLLISDYTET